MTCYNPPSYLLQRIRVFISIEEGEVEEAEEDPPPSTSSVVSSPSPRLTATTTTTTTNTVHHHVSREQLPLSLGENSHPPPGEKEKLAPIPTPRLSSGGESLAPASSSPPSSSLPTTTTSSSYLCVSPTWLKQQIEQTLRAQCPNLCVKYEASGEEEEPKEGRRRAMAGPSLPSSSSPDGSGQRKASANECSSAMSAPEDLPTGRKEEEEAEERKGIPVQLEMILLPPPTLFSSPSPLSRQREAIGAAIKMWEEELEDAKLRVSAATYTCLVVVLARRQRRDITPTSPATTIPRTTITEKKEGKEEEEMKKVLPAAAGVTAASTRAMPTRTDPHPPPPPCEPPRAEPPSPPPSAANGFTPPISATAALQLLGVRRGDVTYALHKRQIPVLLLFSPPPPAPSSSSFASSSSSSRSGSSGKGLERMTTTREEGIPTIPTTSKGACGGGGGITAVQRYLLFQEEVDQGETFLEALRRFWAPLAPPRISFSFPRPPAPRRMEEVQKKREKEEEKEKEERREGVFPKGYILAVEHPELVLPPSKWSPLTHELLKALRTSLRHQLCTRLFPPSHGPLLPKSTNDAFSPGGMSKAAKGLVKAMEGDTLAVAAGADVDDDVGAGTAVRLPSPAGNPTTRIKQPQEPPEEKSEKYFLPEIVFFTADGDPIDISEEDPFPSSPPSSAATKTLMIGRREENPHPGGEKSVSSFSTSRENTTRWLNSTRTPLLPPTPSPLLALRKKLMILNGVDSFHGSEGNTTPNSTGTRSTTVMKKTKAKTTDSSSTSSSSHKSSASASGSFLALCPLSHGGKEKGKREEKNKKTKKQKKEGKAEEEGKEGEQKQKKKRKKWIKRRSERHVVVCFPTWNHCHHHRKEEEKIEKKVSTSHILLRKETALSSSSTITTSTRHETPNSTRSSQRTRSPASASLAAAATTPVMTSTRHDPAMKSVVNNNNPTLICVPRDEKGEGGDGEGVEEGGDGGKEKEKCRLHRSATCTPTATTTLPSSSRMNNSSSLSSSSSSFPSCGGTGKGWRPAVVNSAMFHSFHEMLTAEVWMYQRYQHYALLRHLYVFQGCVIVLLGQMSTAAIPGCYWLLNSAGAAGVSSSSSFSSSSCLPSASETSPNDEGKKQVEEEKEEKTKGVRKGVYNNNNSNNSNNIAEKEEMIIISSNSAVPSHATGVEASPGASIPSSSLAMHHRNTMWNNRRYMEEVERREIDYHGIAVRLQKLLQHHFELEHTYLDFPLPLKTLFLIDQDDTPPPPPPENQEKKQKNNRNRKNKCQKKNNKQKDTKTIGKEKEKKNKKEKLETEEMPSPLSSFSSSFSSSASSRMPRPHPRYHAEDWLSLLCKELRKEEDSRGVVGEDDDDDDDIDKEKKKEENVTVPAGGSISGRNPLYWLSSTAYTLPRNKKSLTEFSYFS